MIQLNEQHLSTIYEKSSEGPLSQSQRPNRCLLANDNTFLLMAFEQTLLPHFEIVDVFENGKEALEKVLLKRPSYYSVIILDIQMPIMDGIEACKKIKEYF
mmetsp:Transcript_44917/g.59626  ORF Transcript_44917/g.59626 Transcript_44917/m.59626 type:complete len:101 (-) Transcript_44917:565-867(-)